jgi:aspartokinase/homoserine dehydrogenase 1
MQSKGPAAWVVHKFGGSSVADAGCFRKVADILESQPGPRLAVVLSACKGVTDTLLGVVGMAERGDAGITGQLQALRDRHQIIAETLLDPAAAAKWLARFDQDRSDLEGVLHTTRLMRSAAQNVRDLVAGYGELWSSSLFFEYLSARRQSRDKGPDKDKSAPVRWLDARQCVVVECPAGPGHPVGQLARRHRQDRRAGFRRHPDHPGVRGAHAAGRADHARPQWQ